MASLTSGSQSDDTEPAVKSEEQSVLKSDTLSQVANPDSNSKQLVVFVQANPLAQRPVPVLSSSFSIQDSSLTVVGIDQATALSIILHHPVLNPFLPQPSTSVRNLLPPPTELHPRVPSVDIASDCIWSEGFSNKIFNESFRKLEFAIDSVSNPILQSYKFKASKAGKAYWQEVQLPVYEQEFEMALTRIVGGMEKINGNVVWDETLPASEAFLEEVKSLWPHYKVTYSSDRNDRLRTFLREEGVKPFLLQCHTNQMRQNILHEQKKVCSIKDTDPAAPWNILTQDEYNAYMQKQGGQSELPVELPTVSSLEKGVLPENSTLSGINNKSGSSTGIKSQIEVASGISYSKNNDSSFNGSVHVGTSSSELIRAEETPVLQKIDDLSQANSKTNGSSQKKKGNKHGGKKGGKKEKNKHRQQSKAKPSASNKTISITNDTPDLEPSVSAVDGALSTCAEETADEHNYLPMINENLNIEQAPVQADEDSTVKEEDVDTSQVVDEHRPVHKDSDFFQPGLIVPERSYHEKSKSLSAAEVARDLANTPSSITEAIERLTHDPTPLTLDESQRRRASIKQERRESISLIRNRTQSRASSRGLPDNVQTTSSPVSDSKMTSEVGENGSDPYIHAHPRVEESPKVTSSSATDGLMVTSKSSSVILDTCHIQQNKCSSTASGTSSEHIEVVSLLPSAVSRSSKAAPLPEPRAEDQGDFLHPKNKRKSGSKNKRNREGKGMNHDTTNCQGKLVDPRSPHRGQNSVSTSLSVGPTYGNTENGITRNAVQDRSKNPSKRTHAKDIFLQPEALQSTSLHTEDEKLVGSLANGSMLSGHSAIIEGQKDKKIVANEQSGADGHPSRGLSSQNSPQKIVSTKSVPTLSKDVDNHNSHSESGRSRTTASSTITVSTDGQNHPSSVRYKSPPVVSSQTRGLYDPAKEPVVSKTKSTDLSSFSVQSERCDSDYENAIGPHLGDRRKLNIKLIPIDYFMQGFEKPQQLLEKSKSPIASGTNEALSKGKNRKMEQDSTKKVISETEKTNAGQFGADNGSAATVSQSGHLPVESENPALVSVNNRRRYHILQHPQTNMSLQPGYTFKCQKCGVSTSDTSQFEPAVICSGCGPSTAIRYCSVGCLLADSVAHASRCGKEGGEWPISWEHAPHHWYQMIPGFRPLVPEISTACFRQMTYFMRAHDFPVNNPILAVWDLLSDADRARYEVDHSNDLPYIYPADYFLFNPSTDTSTEIQDLEIMFYFDFKRGWMEQIFFHRALNAAFLTHDAMFVEFVYFMLHDFFSNVEPNHIYSDAYLADCKDILDAQILAEFNWDPATSTKKSEDFGPLAEWYKIEEFIYKLELQNPLLRAWVRNNSHFPADHRARIRGDGWMSISGIELIRGDIADFGIGWSGIGEREWQDEIDMLREGRISL